MKKLAKKTIYKIFFQLISILKIQFILIYLSYFFLKLKTKKRYINNSQNRINALVVDKAGFDTDLLPLQSTQKINLFLFPENWLMTIVKSFLDEKLHCQIEYHFHDDELSIKQKNKLESIFINILKYLQNKLDINVILVKNFDYFEHQDLCKAAKKLNLKIVVIYCESVTTEFSANSFTEAKSIKKRVKFPFDLILVSGPNGKNLLVQNEVCNENEIVVTGYCRTDVIYNTSLENITKNRDLVVLFDFGFEDFLFYDEDGYGAPKLAYSVTEEFGKLSKNFLNEYKFVIKTRTNENVEKVYQYLKNFNVKKSDITVTGNLTMREVVKRAKLVVGYTSTTTLELLGTNLPFIVPYWFEAQQNTESGNSFFDDKNHPGYIKTNDKKEFNKTVTAILSNKYNLENIDELSTSRKKLIYNNLFSIDGKASQRTFEALEKLVLIK